MVRSLHSDFNTAIQASSVHPAFLVKINTSGGDVLAWTGVGDIVYDSDTYVGVGTAIGISQIQEKTDLTASGVTFTLSGIPSALVSTALGQVQHGRACQLFLVLLNTTTGALIDNPYELFNGFTDVTIVTEQESTCTIGIQAENRLVDLERPRIRRYTDEDQKSDTANASDVGFEFVQGLQDKVITFGSS
jgi:hypothetical protein|tara:strand:- start:2894 stop:3463 length:570 start_codon:yes stop_codon:yes gene_type:complete